MIIQIKLADTGYIDCLVEILQNSDLGKAYFSDYEREKNNSMRSLDFWFAQMRAKAPECRCGVPTVNAYNNIVIICHWRGKGKNETLHCNSSMQSLRRLHGETAFG